jgi:hypothetical protein
MPKYGSSLLACQENKCPSQSHIKRVELGLELLMFSLRRLRPVECRRAPPFLAVHSVQRDHGCRRPGHTGAHVNDPDDIAREPKIGLPQICA